MDRKEMAKQVFDYQKNTFDSFIDSIATIQDQAEKSLTFFLDRNPWVPEESKSIILNWGNIYKKGREDFKKVLDDGFDRMGTYYERATDAAPKEAQHRERAKDAAPKEALHREKATDASAKEALQREKATDASAKEALQRGARSTDEAGKKASESMSKASQNLRQESKKL